MTQITSFVFFDIETTGLPWQERNQTKIIELSFVAALRKDILNTSFGNTPPVSKLTCVLNPRREINPEVTNMTGLDNDLLKHAPVFRQKIKSLLTFLDDLPKPICLVAHNGNNFDFKILLAECNDVKALLPTELLCVDSLVGFRKLLKGTNINFSNLGTSEQPTSSVDDLITDDEDEWPDLNVSSEEWQEIDEICLSLSDISCEDFTEEEQKKECYVNKGRSKAIKKLFENKPKKDQKKPKVDKQKQIVNKESFTLSALYKRLLNKEDPNAHRAEVDCLMLVQCVVAFKDFLLWADKNCKNISEIKPLIRYS